MTFKKGVRLFSVVWVYLILIISVCKFTNPEITYCIEDDFYIPIAYEVIDFENYYYSQLNNIEREIYNNLISSEEKFLKEEEITFTVNFENGSKIDSVNTLLRTFQAYTYDNPEVAIWFNNYKKFYSDSNDYIYVYLKPNFKTNEYSTLKNAQEEFKDFEIVANNFVKTLSGTDIEKITQIHNWLIEICTYDYTHSLPNSHNAYGTIIEGSSVCSGFAYAFKYIANLADLNVLYVTGKCYNQTFNTFEPHAWNIVYVDNRYFLVDVTFDGSLSSTKFMLSQINDNIHFISTSYFDYPF